VSARRRWIDIGLTSFTYLVLLVMLAPVLWLVASSLQPNGNLANGEYDLLHPTLDAFGDMWRNIDFERYLANSIVICTGAAALATAFASSAG
jgi:multiple sugar transport system permease protein